MGGGGKERQGGVGAGQGGGIGDEAGGGGWQGVVLPG